jgi:hypothetical protein
MLKLVVTPDGYDAGSNTRVDLYDDTGFYGRLSTNMPEQLNDPDRFWLKDWSENKDLARTLIDDGSIVIDDAVAPVASGFVTVKAARVAGSAR